MANIAFTDAWGEGIQRPEHDTIEIRWFDSTEALNGDEIAEGLRCAPWWSLALGMSAETQGCTTAVNEEPRQDEGAPDARVQEDP